MPKQLYKCRFCGSDVLRWKSTVRKKDSVFCNKKCLGLYFKKLKLLCGKLNHNYKNGNRCEESYCICGKEKDFRSKLCADCSKKSFSKNRGKINSSFYLKKGYKTRTWVVRKYILKENILPYICEKCGQRNEWFGSPLVLQLHHKDGNGTNNEISNLCFLCPNCHTQTDNYAHKKQNKEI